MDDGQLIKVGIANHFDGRSLAFALDYPGCFAFGSEETEALIRIPQAVVAFKNWLDGNTPASWLRNLQDFDIRLLETFDIYTIDGLYEPAQEGKRVGEFFHHDWLSLTGVEIDRGLQVLRWAHQDLYELTANLTDAQIDRKYPDESLSIRGILFHVADTEWRFLDRLSSAPYSKESLPDDPRQRLEVTLWQNEAVLPAFTDKEHVFGHAGELWSPRKVLRRECYHALDHCQHIHRLITSG